MCTRTEWILETKTEDDDNCTPAQREVYIEIPIEDREAGDEGMVGKLNLSLYGARDAALNWTKEYTRALEEIRYVKGKVSACNFRHVQRDVKLSAWR